MDWMAKFERFCEKSWQKDHSSIFDLWGVINLYLYFASNYVIKGDKILTLRDCLLSSFDFTLSTITAFGWFLPALFLTELAFVILSNILGTNKKLFGFYIFIVMLGMHLGAFFIMKLPLALYVLPFTLGFFAFGFLFKNVIANARYKQKSISLLLALFVICWYFIPVIVNVRTSIYNPLYVSWFVCLLVSLAIIVLVHHFESRIVNCYSYKWVKFLGRNTLLIYLLHNEFIRILPLKKICIDSVSLSTMVQLLVTLGILCLLWFVIRFINKHLAWTIGNF